MDREFSGIKAYVSEGDQSIGKINGTLQEKLPGT
jgi:hypothetical protein